MTQPTFFSIILVAATALIAGCPAAQAQPAAHRPEPWFLLAPVEQNCVPPAEVFAAATTPEKVAAELSGGGNAYVVHYSRKTAAASDRAILKDGKGGGGDVTLIRGKEACLLALQQRTP